MIIIGGGAAGFFAALRAKSLAPERRVLILEKTTKVLAKVKISGGGRCNVTHDTADLNFLLKHYPRGEKLLKQAFRKFSAVDTVKWFESRGVKLKTEEDGRMFPITDDSQTIVDCLMKEVEKLGVEIEVRKTVQSISKIENSWQVTCADATVYSASTIIIAAGGMPQIHEYNFCNNLNLDIVAPVPSLFSFNLKSHRYKGLEGIAVQNASVRLQGSKLSAEGPLLVTHWGFSGPAVLKLSAWAARELNDKQYKANIHINWVAGETDESLRGHWSEWKSKHGQRQVMTHPMFNFPKRLWERQLEIAEFPDAVKWAEAPSKNVNKLTEEIRNGEFSIEGKTTFKEEFVTAGGIALSNVNPETLESRKHPGIFFAGEVLDIDALTGGFNFQAAWTTGWIAGENAVNVV